VSGLPLTRLFRQAFQSKKLKSGKDYKRHSALSNVLSSPNYEIEQAIVLCESNVIEDGKVAYLPIYMIMFV
jgi:hypothetical protein